jgi:hypothetical protein
MQAAASAKVVSAIKEAEQGVDYSPKDGAACPFCGEKAKVYNTLSWTGNSRVRYHRCPNERCPLYQLERSIKSVESI